MAESVNTGISMALDMKKNRIRIHKPTIHLLGDPTLIQLLFNPENLDFAIVCPETEVPGGQEIRIPKRYLKSDNCVEVYSKMFLRKLRKLHGHMDDDGVYRLSGKLIPSMRAVWFPMSSLQRVELEEGVSVHD